MSRETTLLTDTDQANTTHIDTSHINTWIFDLDNTLYRADGDFFKQIVDKITEYMSRYLALSPSEARVLQKEYYHKYGTSLSGLMTVHDMDPAEFLAYVHDVDLKNLRPDPTLYKGLSALNGRKFIYTNGSRSHAQNVAKHLEIWDLFDGVFAIEDGDYIAKPNPAPYAKFINRFNIDPCTSLMAEDSPLNLKVPHQMGMKTLLVAPPQIDAPSYVDARTYNLPKWLHNCA